MSLLLSFIFTQDYNFLSVKILSSRNSLCNWLCRKLSFVEFSFSVLTIFLCGVIIRPGMTDMLMKLLQV